MANSVFTIEADGQGYVTFNGDDVEFEIPDFDPALAGEYNSLDDIEFEVGEDAYRIVKGTLQANA